jgi:predicted ester cyclase
VLTSQVISLHTQSFDARPELKRLIVGADEAALEAVFIGSHTGEFQGIPATGKAVNVPYSVHYDLQDDKIAALQIYMSMDALLRQISATP